MFKRILLCVFLFLTVSSAEADSGFPTPCSTCGGAAAFVTYGEARFAQSGNVGTVSQVGDKSILNWRDFNLSNGNKLIFQQVEDLLKFDPIKGATFSVLNRIWDSDPSVIAGMIRGAVDEKGSVIQHPNLIFINQNGIVFANGSSVVDVNSLTASSLNIKDSFFTSHLTPIGNITPQFEGGLDGQTNLGGFIRVMDGAKLTAASGGRVMLIAPSVTNIGDINAPSGQVVLAAGNKVYLTSSGDSSLRGVLVEVDNISLSGDYNQINASVPGNVQSPGAAGVDSKTISLLGETDKLGNATNLGNLTAVKGNVTMVGLAVNQMKRATASTSLLSNGSIYLLAKSDISVISDGDRSFVRSMNAGKVNLGESSITEVHTELGDNSKSRDAFTHSKIEIVGKEISANKDSQVIAHSGIINISAVMDPSSLKATNPNVVDDLFDTSFGELSMAKITFDTGAKIDVSGLNVNSSISDNFLQIKLLGDELSNSPSNRNGPLRGQKVWLDLVKGSPLISNLSDYQKTIERTVAFGSTAAGQVNLKSLGSIIVMPNVKFNLSGGGVTYSAGMVNESKLFGADGKVYDLSRANPDMPFISIANQYSLSYGKWGVTETNSLQQQVYNEGYVSGSNAGSLLLDASQIYFSGQVDGTTIKDANNPQLGNMPMSAQLQIGSAKFNANKAVIEYGLNQNVLIGSAPSFGSISSIGQAIISDDQEKNLRLDASIFGGSAFSRINIMTNKQIDVSSKVNLISGGSFKLTAENINFNADVSVKSGTIEASAKNNIFNSSSILKVSISEGISLSTSGWWVNESLNGFYNINQGFINAGSIKLSAFGEGGGLINFAKDAMLNVQGGAYLTVSSKLNPGKGGDISLVANNIYNTDDLENHFSAESFAISGSVNLTTTALQIGGQKSKDDLLYLNSKFFNQGFQNYNLIGLEGLAVADNTKINVQSKSLDILPTAAIKPTNAQLNQVGYVITQTDQLRKPANISLSAAINGFNTNNFGSELVIGNGVEINTDPEGKILLSATKSVDINGKLNAPAGIIDITLLQNANVTNDPENRIHLNAHSSLIANGVAKVYNNSKGLLLGEILSGGTINISAREGYVDTEQGALIDVHGALPVRLDIPNLNNLIGQTLAGNAGSVNIFGETGVYLDNIFNAHAGSAEQKGGAFSIQLSSPNLLKSNSIIHLGNFSNLSPDGFQNPLINDQAYADMSKLELSGFERIAVGGYKILLEGDISLGQTTRSLQSVKLDAPNIKSSGGQVNIKASIIQIGNSFIGNQSSSNTPEVGTGLLALNSDLTELRGTFSLSGFDHLIFDTKSEFRLTGIQPLALPQSFGTLRTLAGIDISAGVVTPSSLTNFDISTSGDVQFFNLPNSVLTSPLSVMGKLSIHAKNINQNGSIIAPFGQIELKASNAILLGAGSITSVAVDSGKTLLLGMTLNGLSWFIDSNKDTIASDSESIKTLPTKAIKLDATDIKIMPADLANSKAAAIIDLSGGGDILAWEFSSGPGGTNDFLNSNGYYSIVPGYSGIASPIDPMPNNFNLAIGQSLYLAGGSGLNAGNYTLLPAKYALLPGAYAVRLTGVIPDIVPSNSFKMSDGTSIIAGFVTDSRFSINQLSNARWSGFEVLNSDQINKRSEYKLTFASEFFAKDGISYLPKDAGMLQLNSSNSLSLKGTFKIEGGIGGNGASVDINADKIAIVDETTLDGVLVGEVALEIASLNAMKSDSLLIGGIRNTSASGVVSIDVKASKVRIDSVYSQGRVSSGLIGHEVMLVATDEVDIQNNSYISAFGQNENSRSYSIGGDSAFVRVASSDSTLQHTGSISRSNGVIKSSYSANITSSKSVTLDSTAQNTYKGSLVFSVEESKVESSLIIGSNLINFGDVPNEASGLSFDSEKLKLLTGIDKVTLRSYSSFDFYGTANLGNFDTSDLTGASNGFSIKNLTLQGGSLRGLGPTSGVVNIQAKSLEISNPDNISVVTNNNINMINTELALKTQVLTLGKGDKVITGFSKSSLDASYIIGKDSGSLSFDGLVNINTSLISGIAGAKQSIETNKAMVVSKSGGGSTLSDIDGLGVRWKFNATNLDFGSNIKASGGKVNLTATVGNLSLLNTAKIDVSGQIVDFFDQSRVVPAGTVNLSSITGNISAEEGTEINVSAPLSGDAGHINFSAKEGSLILSTAKFYGLNDNNDKSPTRGLGASIFLDASVIDNFDTLNTQLNVGGFSEMRDFRLRTGNFNYSLSNENAIKANNVKISVDSNAKNEGQVYISGEINASGVMSANGKGGEIAIYATQGLTLGGDANLHAEATKSGAKGGRVLLGTSSGILSLLPQSTINVSGVDDGIGGEVLIRSLRTGSGAGNGVAVALNGNIIGSASTVLEAVKVYNGFTSINSSATTSSNLSTTTIDNDVTTFMGNKADILSALGKTRDPTFHLKPGVEIRSVTNLTVGTTQSDWDLYTKFRSGGESGFLTLRANGDLIFNGSLSDGVVKAINSDIRDSVGVGESWSYRLVAGADTLSANPIAVKTDKSGNFILSANKLIRTGTGSIQISAGGNFELGTQANKVNQQTASIYTLGSEAPELGGFALTDLDLEAEGEPTAPQLNNFTQNGGNIFIDIIGNINGAKTNQLYSNWLFRQGSQTIDGQFDEEHPQTAWWVRFDQFQQGIGALGGGDVYVKTGGIINELSVSSASNGRLSTDQLTVLGGGNITVRSGGDILGGSYYVAKGLLSITTDGSMKKDTNLFTTVALGDAQAKIYSLENLNLQAVINPTIVAQKEGTNRANNTSGIDDIKRSIFSTYTDSSAISVQSLTGNVVLHNNIEELTASSIPGNIGFRKNSYQQGLLSIYPGNLQAVAYNGDLVWERNAVLFPSSNGSLDLLAQKNVKINGSFMMSDADISLLPTALDVQSYSAKGLVNQLSIVLNNHRITNPLHQDDKLPVRIYAIEEDIAGTDKTRISLKLPKVASIRSGRDITNIDFTGQNIDASDVTLIKAGRDIKYTNANQYLSRFMLGGPGSFEFEVGRNLDLGVSAGISTSGDLGNAALIREGASIKIAVGLPNGVDYAGAIDRLVSSIESEMSQGKPLSDNVLWQARWLVGDERLGSATSATTLLAAVSAIKFIPPELQSNKVRAMFYQALLDTGRDYNNVTSQFAGNYERGYSTIELLFPGVGKKNNVDSTRNYIGQLDLSLSSIKTNRGGDIEYMVPGGRALVGLAQISDAQLPPGRKTTDLGIVAIESGAIRGFTRDDMLVNQSRILTVGGGDILLWSSEGNLDAGKGKRTASTLPPPIIRIDENGLTTIELQGAATGSGIGALGANAGDVDLIAPEGTVNAGDAGVRARNVNIAAQFVLNAGNISASGTTSGTPVADTGALGSSLAGASGIGTDAVKSASENVAKKITPSNMLKPEMPSIINVEVISLGN